jgi:uncharacterized membrane protein
MNNVSLKSTVLIAAVAIVLLLLMPSMASLNGEAGPDFFIFLGRFHIVVLHIPIGWLLMVPIADLIGKYYALPGFNTAARVILLLGAISAVIAAVFGFTLATSDGYAGSTVTYHMWAGIITCTAAILACVFKQASVTYHNPIVRSAYAVCLSVALIAITVGGHLGGALVQGDGYLSEKMPVALKGVLGIENNDPTQVTMESPIYAGVIEPILKHRCMSCHNADKEKGQFRMDTFAALLSGGKSQKVAITPSSLESSELFRRITLERHEKKVMPPKSKDPLEAQQVALLKWWIEIGAPESTAITELSPEQYPSDIAGFIDDLINGTDADQPQRQLPELDPAVMQQQSIALKSQFGVDVAMVSQKTEDGLHITTVNMTSTFDEAVWSALKPLASNVVSMNLGGSSISADDFKHLVDFIALEKLLLNNTQVTEGDLAYLAGLTKLRTLNLFNTNIGDEALAHLLKLRSLKGLYLHQTNISPQGAQRIKKALPRCNIIGISGDSELAMRESKSQKI